jgi:hypothetical protein
VVLGKQPIPLGRVNLHVTFEDASNYHTEMLTFEVVDFSEPYHVILRRPYYVKFMVIPSYTYLKLKFSRGDFLNAPARYSVKCLRGLKLSFGSIFYQ